MPFAPRKYVLSQSERQHSERLEDVFQVEVDASKDEQPAGGHGGPPLDLGEHVVRLAHRLGAVGQYERYHDDRKCGADAVDQRQQDRPAGAKQRLSTFTREQESLVDRREAAGHPFPRREPEPSEHRLIAVKRVLGPNTLASRGFRYG